MGSEQTFFVDLDAEAGSRQGGDAAVDAGEILFVDDVVEEVGAVVVVNADALFLQRRVPGNEVDLQARG